MKAGRLKANLAPEEITVVIDTREQQPFSLNPLRSIRRALTTGDYSLYGLEHVVAIERKSLDDLVRVSRQRRRAAISSRRAVNRPACS